MRWQSIVVAGLVSLAGSAGAQTSALPSATRGELLYTTHCIACHTTKVHWREKKIVSDLPSLQSEVHRWQAIAALGWSSNDIAEVSRYLNALHYRFPTPN